MLRPHSPCGVAPRRSTWNVADVPHELRPTPGPRSRTRARCASPSFRGTRRAVYVVPRGTSRVRRAPATCTTGRGCAPGTMRLHHACARTSSPRGWILSASATPRRARSTWNTGRATLPKPAACSLGGHGQPGADHPSPTRVPVPARGGRSAVHGVTRTGPENRSPRRRDPRGTCSMREPRMSGDAEDLALHPVAVMCVRVRGPRAMPTRARAEAADDVAPAVPRPSGHLGGASARRCRGRAATLHRPIVMRSGPRAPGTRLPAARHAAACVEDVARAARGRFTYGAQRTGRLPPSPPSHRRPDVSLTPAPAPWPRAVCAHGSAHPRVGSRSRGLFDGGASRRERWLNPRISREGTDLA